jgi:hypothetical protein
MIFMIRILILWLCVVTALQAQQIPGSEIYLFDLKNGKDGIVLSNPKNITSHRGYDNQPFFHPEKPLLYFSSANEDTRTDIVEYDLTTGASRKITSTPEREYSPTVTPDKKFISCIIQRDNGAQDLGKYPINGGTPEIIINNLTVGYHAWLDDDRLFVFVLGEKNSLHEINLKEKSDQVIEQNIGRSIHRADAGHISYIHKESSEKWFIKTIPSRGPKLTLGETLPGREDIAWTPEGNIIISDGEKFFYSNGRAQPLEWKEAKAEGISLKGITRIAVNRDGTKIAVVVSE